MQAGGCRTPGAVAPPPPQPDESRDDAVSLSLSAAADEPLQWRSDAPRHCSVRTRTARTLIKYAYRITRQLQWIYISKTRGKVLS